MLLLQYTLQLFIIQLLYMYLHVVGEGDTDNHKLIEQPQQLQVGEHTFLETLIEQVQVIIYQLINIARL